MAKTTLPKLRKSREYARDEMEAQIEKGQQLRNQEIPSDHGLEEARTESIKWSDYNRTLLRKLFDNASVAEDDYIDFDDYPPIVLASSLPRPFSDKLDWYRNGMDSSINSLKGICDCLKLYDEPSDMPQHTSGNEGVSDKPQSTFDNKVFIIHGRDDGVKGDVALFVRDLGLKEIILDRQPNSGLIAILDKFEREAKKADFAIALLTPDDVGALKDEADDQLKPRARQNVIFELGYFISRLGRKKVCLLLTGKLENPSDLDGILYVSMNSRKGWQLELGIEMKQAGLPVDLNKLTPDK